MYDVIVIGAGIIGSTVFYELSKRNIKALIIEKNEVAGMGVTGHNSAIIHNGTDPAPNTLKEKYNTIAHKMYESYCKELETPYRAIGAFVVAKTKEDMHHIDELEQHAKERDIFVRRLSKEEALKLEPNLASDIYAVLDMPTTAVINPTHMSAQAVAKGVNLGNQAVFSEEVVGISKNGHFSVKTNKGTYQAKMVVNAAGLYAPHIEQMITDSTFKLIMRRGEYVVMSKEALSVSKRIFYPVPTKLGKGVLFVPTWDDRALVGPNAIDVDSPEDDYITEEGIAEIKEKVKSLVPNVPYEYEINRYAGIRPKADRDDFIIAESEKVPLFFNLAGIDSPGIASAPAIAIDFVENMIQPKLN